MCNSRIMDTTIAERHRPCPACAGTGKIPAYAQAPPTGTMGRRIFDLAGERALTQEALAALLQRSQPAISLWMSGGRKPNLDDLCRLADLFSTTVDYIIGRVPDR